MASRMDPHSSGFHNSVGCFTPEEIAQLELALRATLDELHARPGSTGKVDEVDSDDLRKRLAAAIICHAKSGKIDPIRLKTIAIEALDQGILPVRDGG